MFIIFFFIWLSFLCFWFFILFFFFFSLHIKFRIREHPISYKFHIKKTKLTFFIKQKDSTSLEAEVLRHEFSHLGEQSLEMPLGANFRGKLQGINDCLFLFIYFFLGGNFFDLHSHILANDFKDLFVRGVETVRFISFFIHFSLALDYQENLIVSEKHWLSH